MIPSFTRVVTQEKKSEDGMHPFCFKFLALLFVFFFKVKAMSQRLRVLERNTDKHYAEYVSITTNKFKLSFKTNDHMIMLLHVCSESRDVVRKKYPIQLPMERFADQDVRMNSFDILSIANLSDLLRDLEQAKENKLAIPPFISTIDKLAWVSQYNHQYHDHDPTQLVTITRMDRYRAPPLLSLPRSLQRFPGFGDARFCASLTDLHKNGSLDLLPRLKQILLVADEDRSTVESDFSSFAEVGVLDSSNEKAYDPASSFVRAVLTWKDIYRSLEQNKIQLDWEVPEMKIFVKNIARHVSDTNESYDHLNCARLATRTK